jgi:4-nitrophenyl phosphatase
MNSLALDKARAIEALILDMDGVLWRGPQPIGDLPAIFRAIAARGWKVALATNNATRSPAQFAEKLRGFGVQVEASQVINSAQAAAEYLREQHPQGGPVYAIGEEGLLEALGRCGFHFSDQDALAVVVALNREMTYAQLCTAHRLLLAGVPFIGANPDRTLPTPEGPIPGSGAILAALEASTGIQPLIIGKPHPAMYRVALARLGVPAAHALAIGDRLETDIAGGKAAGCLTALVLSGVSTAEAARSSPFKPDLVAQDLATLLELICDFVVK